MKKTTTRGREVPDELAAEGPTGFDPSASRSEDHSRVGDASGLRQAPGALASPMRRSLHRARARGRIHLVVGPVGAGKSTFASRLAGDQAAVRLTLDQWMADLFRPDRPDQGVIAWYVERAARCVEQIMKVAHQVLDVGVDVVLEIGLLQQRARSDFYKRVHEAGVDLTIYVLDASRDVRRARVEQRNHARGPTFSMVVPPDVFELASDLWEPPEPSEHEGLDVRLIRT